MPMVSKYTLNTIPIPALRLSVPILFAIKDIVVGISAHATKNNNEDITIIGAIPIKKLPIRW